MSNDNKAEVQVTHPGYAFSHGSVQTHPHSSINQWCRFSVPERFSLKPFRQDRLSRLPLPPSIMAPDKSTSISGSMGTVSASSPTEDCSLFDPFQKIQQLEKNLTFVQENHAVMLKDLHEEIDDLKQKNRELIFQVVTGLPALSKENDVNQKDVPEDLNEKMEKLEKEVKELRGTLKDALKTNSSLTTQLQQLKRQYSQCRNYKTYRKSPNSADDGRQLHSLNGPSPQIEEYVNTLWQIQKATSHHIKKKDDKHHHIKDVTNNLSDNCAHIEYHPHHHQQKLHRHLQTQQQPRLPRLPLYNQQNFHQYGFQYQTKHSNTLPALKQPLVSVVDHRLAKPRKSKNERAAKLADEVTNG